MNPTVPLTFLFDIDNTLLDHDRVTAQLKAKLSSSVGPDCADRYWRIFNEIRSELGYADYLGALQRYRLENMHGPQLLEVSRFLLQYPFEEREFPGAFDTVREAQKFGQTVILSDGDVVFQPLKTFRSGIFDLFEAKILIYIHKEQELADVAKRFPSQHYVMIDDKIRLLTAIKAIWQDKVTTVFVRQGHYAADTKTVAQYPSADITIEGIAGLIPLLPGGIQGLKHP